MEKDKDITQIVSKEILDRSLDLSIDYAEIAIDEFITNDVLGEVPIVKSIVSFYKIGNSVINRHNTKKILAFFQEFNTRQIDRAQIKTFQDKFTSDSKYQSEVTDIVVLLNERFLQVEKSKILANLIAAHIESKLSWKELKDIAFVLDSIHPKGFSFLKKMSALPNWVLNTFNNDPDESLMFACGIGKRSGTRFSIEDMGQKLYRLGIEPAKLIL